METDLIVATGAILVVIVCNFVSELRAIDAMTTRSDQPPGASVAPNAGSAIRSEPGTDDRVVHLAPTPHRTP
jgi:hypothetical protein